MVFPTLIRYLRSVLEVPEADITVSPMGGLNTSAYRLDIGTKAYAIKCSRQLEHEIHGLWASRAAGCLVPALLMAVNSADNPLRSPFFVSDFVVGSPLTSDTASRSALSSLRRSLSLMSSIRVRSLWKMQPQYDAAISLLSPRSADIARTLPWNYDLLSHGDFTPTNLLVQKDGQVCLVDWEQWHFGDPTFDLGRLAVHGSPWSSNDLRPLALWVDSLDAGLFADCIGDSLKFLLGVLAEIARLDSDAAKSFVAVVEDHLERRGR